MPPRPPPRPPPAVPPTPPLPPSSPPWPPNLPPRLPPVPPSLPEYKVAEALVPGYAVPEPLQTDFRQSYQQYQAAIQTDATALVKKIETYRLLVDGEVDMLREVFYLSTSWRLICDCAERAITLDATQVQIFPPHVADERFFQIPLRIASSPQQLALNAEESVYGICRQAVRRHHDDGWRRRGVHGGRMSLLAISVNCTDSTLLVVQRGSQTAVSEHLIVAFWTGSSGGVRGA